MQHYSANRKKQIKIYNSLRAEFLSKYPRCEWCKMPATEIHHKKGRMGEMLNETKYFMSVCRTCHLWIEDHPREAKEKGFTLDRLL